MKSVCHANCSLLRASTGILKPNFAEDVPILSTGESLCARLGVGHKLIDTPDLDLRLHMTPFVTASSNYRRRKLRKCPAPISPHLGPQTLRMSARGKGRFSGSVRSPIENGSASHFLPVPVWSKYPNALKDHVFYDGH